jgi:uncharacterized protein
MHCLEAVLHILAIFGFVVGLSSTPLPARTDRSIYDTAGVIDDAAETRLENMHRELFEKAGVAIVMVSVPQLENETIEQLAVRIGQSWGVGRKGEDRGLVVAFARDDRKIFVATGYGTEGYLPDGRVGAILDEVVPLLKQDRFSEGLEQLDALLVSASAEEYGVTVTGAPPPPPRAYSDGGLGVGDLIFLVILVVLVASMARRRGGGGGLFSWFLLGNLFGGRRGGGDDDFFNGGGGGFGGFGGGGFGGGGAGRDF